MRSRRGRLRTVGRRSSLASDVCYAGQEVSYDLGLIVLGPMRCIWHDVKRRVGEQPGDLACQGRAQVTIRCTKDDRYRDLQVTESTALDELVLLVERIEQSCCPGANGCEGVGLIGAAEELRQIDCTATPWGSRASIPQ